MIFIPQLQGEIEQEWIGEKLQFAQVLIAWVTVKVPAPRHPRVPDGFPMMHDFSVADGSEHLWAIEQAQLA